jgi:hypothetical protein
MATAEERTKKAVDQLQHMIDRLQSAGPGYTADVIVMHSLEDWMVQISIKATRARYACSITKAKDELIDTANYCALALSLIDDAEQSVAPTIIKLNSKVVIVPREDDIHG